MKLNIFSSKLTPAMILALTLLPLVSNAQAPAEPTPLLDCLITSVIAEGGESIYLTQDLKIQVGDKFYASKIKSGSYTHYEAAYFQGGVMNVLQNVQSKALLISEDSGKYKFMVYLNRVEPIDSVDVELKGKGLSEGTILEVGDNKFDSLSCISTQEGFKKLEALK